MDADTTLEILKDIIADNEHKHSAADRHDALRIFLADLADDRAEFIGTAAFSCNRPLQAVVTLNSYFHDSDKCHPLLICGAQLTEGLDLDAQRPPAYGRRQLPRF